MASTTRVSRSVHTFDIKAAIDAGLVPVVIDLQAPADREMRARPLYVQSAIVGAIFAFWWGVSAIAGLYLVWGVLSLAIAGGLLIAGPVGLVAFAIWTKLNLQAFRQYIEFLPSSAAAPPTDLGISWPQGGA